MASRGDNGGAHVMVPWFWFMQMAKRLFIFELRTAPVG